MPLDLKTKCLGFDSDIQQAMFEAVDLLNARLDALEADISTILGILNSPLDPSMAIERLRILMEQYP